MAETNFRYYKPRCAHGISLSTEIHALVAARLGDTAMALRYLRATAVTDLDLDTTSAGGVRIGLGALWQAVMLGFAGLDMTGDTRSGVACRSECARVRTSSIARSRSNGSSCGSESSATIIIEHPAVAYALSAREGGKCQLT
jgi:hypothetical protein